MAHTETSQDRNTQPPFDRQLFGRLVRAARVIAGLDTVGELAELIDQRFGVRLSDRTIYAIERGEQDVTVTQYIAIVMTLNPPGAAIYWDRCLSPEVAAYFQMRPVDG